LIFSMPGRIAQGAVCDVAVAGVDLVPTFFRFAGIDLPWKMHGHDLSPLLADPQAAWPHPALLPYTVSTFGDATSQVPPPKPQREKVPWYVLLRQGRFKYIRTFEAGEIEELYDLTDDPEELVNLALESSHRQRLIELRQAALDELRRTSAKLVDHLPPVAER
jgi:arylsulfatase A-like enzyme